MGLLDFINKKKKQIDSESDEQKTDIEQTTPREYKKPLLKIKPNEEHPIGREIIRRKKMYQESEEM